MFAKLVKLVMGNREVDSSNPVPVGQLTHDDLNCNANLQIGNADNAAGNPAFVEVTSSILALDPATGNPVELTAVQDPSTENWYLQTVDAAPFAYDPVTERLNVSVEEKTVQTVALVSEEAITDTAEHSVIIPFDTLNKFQDWDIIITNLLDQNIGVKFTSSPSSHNLRWVLNDGTINTASFQVLTGARGIPLSKFGFIGGTAVKDPEQFKALKATYGLTTESGIKVIYSCSSAPTSGTFSMVLQGIPI